MEILFGFLIGAVLGLVAHVAANFMMIRIIIDSKTSVEFANNMIELVKTLAAAVFVVYILLGSMAFPFTLFALFFCLTLVRVYDFEATFDEIKGYNLP
jgi:hypothetical protein